MIEAKVQGIPDVNAALREIVPKLRVRAIRNALAAGARLVRNSARGNTPVLNMGNPASAQAVRRGVRRVGTVKRAISVRTSKLAKRRGDIGVFVAVRPAKAGARGARNPNDPFYWRWLNFGFTPRAKHRGAGRAQPGRRFLERGAAMLGQALQVFISTIGPQIAKLNKPKAPAP